MKRLIILVWFVSINFSITNGQRPASRGIDLWVLSKHNGQWKIASIVNEVIPAGQELPDVPEWKF